MKKKLLALVLIVCIVMGCFAMTACTNKKKKSSANVDGTYYAYDIDDDEYDKTTKLVIDGKTFTMYEMGVKVAEGDFKTSGSNFTATMKMEDYGMTLDIKIEGTVSGGVIKITKTTMTAMGQTETDDTVSYYCKEGKRP